MMCKKQGKVFMKQLFKEKYLKSNKNKILKIKWSSKNKIFSKEILQRLAAQIVTNVMNKKVLCRQ
jgi:ATP-dependent phosphoenolpyruvate carboxykinase